MSEDYVEFRVLATTVPISLWDALSWAMSVLHRLVCLRCLRQRLES
jgi:hypothetical protein